MVLSDAFLKWGCWNNDELNGLLCIELNVKNRQELHLWAWDTFPVKLRWLKQMSQQETDASGWGRAWFQALPTHFLNYFFSPFVKYWKRGAHAVKTSRFTPTSCHELEQIFNNDVHSTLLSAWPDARTCSPRLNPPLTAASNARPRLLPCRPTRKTTWTRSPPSLPGSSGRLWRPLPLSAALARRSPFSFLNVLPGGLGSLTWRHTHYGRSTPPPSSSAPGWLRRPALSGTRRAGYLRREGGKKRHTHVKKKKKKKKKSPSSSRLIHFWLAGITGNKAWWLVASRVADLIGSENRRAFRTKLIWVMITVPWFINWT